MKLVVPALLLLRSIHAKPARSEANATEPVAALNPNIDYARSRSIPWWNNLTEDGAGSIASATTSLQQIIGIETTGGPVDYIIVGLGNSADGADYTVWCDGILIAPQFVLSGAGCIGNVDRVFFCMIKQILLMWNKSSISDLITMSFILVPVLMLGMNTMLH